MLLESYYRLKPIIPRRTQLFVRRFVMRRRRSRSASVWPIDETAGSPPRDWGGWPGGKRFAFVLTHDAEGQRGLERSVRLARLEERHGFRSSFNFLAEEYRLPSSVRRELADRGFEVGVHGLTHDGMLYRSRHSFMSDAARINGYLKEWQSVGFRSPAMHRNFEWLGELDVEYDSSSFDTDPFEPYPEGTGTIFPFHIGPPQAKRRYVELPYTLPQDFTLFVVLRERSIDIWRRKLEWIAERGGMALVITHPDYMAFPESHAGLDEYPVARYEELLQYVKEAYRGDFWHALPRDVARFWNARGALESGAHSAGPRDARTRVTAAAGGTPCEVPLPMGSGRTRRKVWIDLDNTPHVPFFLPIIRELERRGFSVVLTARDAFQVCELADGNDLKYRRVGRHYGKHMIWKLAGLLWRSAQLLPFALSERPTIALSHGSRSQLFLCNLLGIPSILLTDYEHAQAPPFCRPRWKIVPDSIDTLDWDGDRRNVRHYPGIKEDVYVPDFSPDSKLPIELGLRDGDLVVTVRPPANEAHYHNPESELLFDDLMALLTAEQDVRIVLLPRNKGQEAAIRARHPGWFLRDKTVVPPHAVDGLNLLWHSDLVVSGGGTMNREAAALGVPVYSIFRGKIGAIDRRLEREGRLVLIQSRDQVRSKLRVLRRERTMPRHGPRPDALGSIVSHVEEIAGIEGLRGARPGGAAGRS